MSYGSECFFHFLEQELYKFVQCILDMYDMGNIPKLRSCRNLQMRCKGRINNT